MQMDRGGSFMKKEVLETILHKYVLPFKDYQSSAYPNRDNNCPATVILHKDGESTLHKEYDAFVEMVSNLDSSLKIDIYTHGLTLPRKPGFLEFLSSLPSRFRMLISFHFFNGDGSKNDYAATDALLREYLDNRHWPANVELILSSHVVRPMTLDMLATWKSSWQKYIDSGQITVHANVNINPWTGRIKEPGTVQFNGCPYGDFGHMFFGVTGNVIACCLDLEEDILFGNVMEDFPQPQQIVRRLEDFYRSQRLAQKDRSGIPQLCRNCFGMERDDLVQIGNL